MYNTTTLAEKLVNFYENFDFYGFRDTLEVGETKEEALKRELREEMEMDIDIISHFLDVHHEYPDFTMNMYSFKCIAKNKEFKNGKHQKDRYSRAQRGLARIRACISE
jgi:8-oxo-dGTP diphosphatase